MEYVLVDEFMKVQDVFENKDQLIEEAENRLRSYWTAAQDRWGMTPIHEIGLVQEKENLWIIAEIW